MPVAAVTAAARSRRTQPRALTGAVCAGTGIGCVLGTAIEPVTRRPRSWSPATRLAIMFNMAASAALTPDQADPQHLTMPSAPPLPGPASPVGEGSKAAPPSPGLRSQYSDAEVPDQSAQHPKSTDLGAPARRSCAQVFAPNRQALPPLACWAGVRLCQAGRQHGPGRAGATSRGGRQPHRPHRRGLWPRLPVTCNRPGTPGAYPVEGHFPRGPAPAGPVTGGAARSRSGPAPRCAAGPGSGGG